MAYTYDDFTKAAQNAGMLQRFSQSDLETAKLSPEYGLSLLRLFQDEDGASTTEQKLLAQESANQLRKSYGTSLPASGSGTGTMHTAGSFTYEKDPEYHQLLDRIVNREQFSYDPQTDPQAAAFRKQYLREAERAREDTIAKAAANSGGTPSSFAVTAAQQAGDYYVGQLNDTLPTLQQNAYQRYLNEVAADIDALGALSADRNFSYQGYLDQQQRLAEAAELMAAKGDYSLLGQLYGLSDDQIALLGGSGGGPRYTSDIGSILDAVKTGRDAVNQPAWGEGLNEASLISLERQLRTMMNAGRYDLVEKRLADITDSGVLSEEQAKLIGDILISGGYRGG